MMTENTESNVEKNISSYLPAWMKDIEKSTQASGL